MATPPRPAIRVSSSGAIDVPLRAGNYYVIGALVEGEFVAYHSSNWREFASFGVNFNSFRNTFFTLPLAIYVDNNIYFSRYHQRLSTTEPH